MKFLMTFRTKAASRERDPSIARFQTMGAQVPKGARLIGRWTRADQSGGFDLLETDEPEILLEFARLWSELSDVTVARVDDEREIAAQFAVS
jgi:hypothetical protein